MAAGVKLDQSRSMFASKAKNVEPNSKDLARNAESSDLSEKERATKIVLDYKAVFLDKTLQENKDKLSESIESEVVSKAISWAKEVDTNEAFEYNEGSISLIAMLLKLSLYQRDRINKLEYTLHTLSQKVNTD